MPFQISPGINISERDLTHVVPNVATSIGAMAGSFQWGPVLQRITVTTENELVKKFGKPDDYTFKSFFTAANYLAYSNNLIVVRNVGAAAKNAVVGDIDNGTSVLVKNKDDYDSTSSYNDQLFIAKYPGVLGNSLKAIAIDNFGWAAAVAAGNSATADQKLFLSNFNGTPGSSQDVIAANGGSGTYNDEIHILVIDSGGQWTGLVGDVLEAHAYVSMAEGAKKIDGSSNYVKDVLSNESDYVWLGVVAKLTENSDDTTPNARNAGSPKVGAVFKMFANSSAAYYPGGILGGSAGSLGVDANDLSAGEYNAGYDLYSNADVVDISLVMQGGATSVTGKHIIDTLASTGTRMDCVAFVSPNIDTVVAAGSISSTIATGVVADKTSEDTVATAFMLAKKMKKVPVRSGVCDGFIGNRILSKYLVGTYHMVEDGASPFHIDKVLREFGCAMGVFQVIDLAGGDIGWATRKRKAPFRHKDDRYVEIADRVCENGWFGQKTSKGYYLYGEGIDFLTPNPEIEVICSSERERVGIIPKTFSDQEILDRYIAAMVYEGTKILQEKIAIRPSDIDVVYTNGYGFPKWRGGPMKYADMIGLDKILLNIQKFSEADSRFWSPPQLLIDLVNKNKNFDSLN